VFPEAGENIPDSFLTCEHLLEVISYPLFYTNTYEAEFLILSERALMLILLPETPPASGCRESVPISERLIFDDIQLEYQINSLIIVLALWTAQPQPNIFTPSYFKSKSLN